MIRFMANPHGFVMNFFSDWDLHKREGWSTVKRIRRAWKWAKASS